MLHSFHYYACYYALLCFLHQQVVSLTIIIDGATTNEWATRDEYQRLVDSNAAAAGPAAQSPFNQQQQQYRGQVVGRFPVNGDLEDQQLGGQQFEQQQDQTASEIREAPLATAEGLQSALDRLDLMEAEEQQPRRQLQRLRQLEQRQRHHNQNTGNQQQRQQSAVGARTLSDLVSVGDDDLDDPVARLKERASAPRKFCGGELVELLDLVCQGRFYSYEEEAQTVYPTISKRFVNYDQQEQYQKPERRRKLRTLNDGNIGGSSPMAGTKAVSAALLLQATDNNGDTGGSHRKQLVTNTNTNDNTDNIGYYPSQDNSNNNNKNNNNTPSLNTNNNSIDNNNDNYSTNLSTNSNNIKNKHSRMARYRRIRGASAECCKQACHIEQLKTYCSAKKP